MKISKAFYNRRQEKIEVELEGGMRKYKNELDNSLFEERNSVYYTDLGDVVKFYYYDKPGTGYGGKVFCLKMKNGTNRELIGPWSSSPGYVNSVFSDYPHLIQVIESTSLNYINVKVDRLKELGLNVILIKNEKDNIVYGYE